MSDLHSQKSPLFRLILFIVCLSIAGSFVAGVHYFTVEFPQQNNVQEPGNSYCLGICQDDCKDAEHSCKQSGSGNCIAESQTCMNTCIMECACSDCKDACLSDYNACTGKPTTCMNNYDTCTDHCPC